MIKILFYALLAYSIGLLFAPAFAHHGHHDINVTLPDININIDSQPPTSSSSEPLADTENSSPISDADLSRLVALSGAASHHFDWSTHRFQASTNAALYDNQQAISFGIAKRFTQIDALWHGSISIPDGGSNELVTFGATWRW
jgi:hypothetical protein